MPVHFHGYSLIRIEVGYRIQFKKNGKTREPDYYIKVMTDTGPHWYFMDAKYKDYYDSRPTENRIDYREEVYEVAVQKYINDIGAIFESDETYKSTAASIRGSYIIMASINERTSLAENDRLFGRNMELSRREEHRLQTDSNAVSYIAGLSPQHRYGAILLVPDYDVELSTLLRLIFEFLETNNNKNHPNLNWCWKCNSTQIDRIESATRGYRKKYYTACPQCGDFRVLTHCKEEHHLIIKHDQGNYHCRDKSKSSKWAFVCSQCGDKL